MSTRIKKTINLSLETGTLNFRAGGHDVRLDLKNVLRARLRNLPEDRGERVSPTITFY